MLEELLKNDKKNPAEVALAMLSYVQLELPAAGSQGESRFVFRLYEPLCDRIFGPLVLPSSTVGKKDLALYRHEEGGWLSERYPWSRNPVSTQQQQQTQNGPPSSRSSGSSGPSSSSSSSSLESDPVVKLLGTAGKATPTSGMDAPLPPPPTLLEAISTESVNRLAWGVSFPFHALPATMQESWLAALDGGEEQPMPSHSNSFYQFQQYPQPQPPSFDPQQPYVSLTENTAALLIKVLRRGPLEQKELMEYRQQRAAADDEHKQQAVSMIKLSPRGFHTPLGSIHSNTIYSPSATSSSPNSTTPDAQEHDGSPKIILSLLEHFLLVFFRFPTLVPLPKTPAPQGGGLYASSSRRTSSRGNMMDKESYGEMVYFHIFRRYMRHFLPYEPEGSRSIALSNRNNRESQLFLRLLISFWMETQGRVKTTPSVLQALRDRHRRSGFVDAADARLDLDAAYNLVVVRYDPPFFQVQRCLRSIIVHVILNPALNSRVLSADDWCLPNSIAILTQPFFNYVRTTFRHASIHQTESPFYGALDAWLIWLEPWNVNETKERDFLPRHATERIMGQRSSTSSNAKRVLSLPKHTQASRYSPEWEPYIAANIHLYTTPLAIFLRRARELDFSAHKLPRSLKLLQRVFRVFTPQIVEALSRHLNPAPTSKLRALIQQHTELLGPYAPPPGPLTLESCQGDMKALLEEMHVQHFKKLRDMGTLERIETFMESIFSFGVVSGEEGTLMKVAERAKAIVGLPITYSPGQVAPTETSATANASATIYMNDGELTDEGFQRVVTGCAKSDPAAVGFVGDPVAQARLMSYEIPILVELTSVASDLLFTKTGVRVQLRFLADYRNILWICLLYWLMRMIFW